MLPFSQPQAGHKGLETDLEIWNLSPGSSEVSKADAPEASLGMEMSEADRVGTLGNERGHCQLQLIVTMQKCRPCVARSDSSKRNQKSRFLGDF